MGEDDTLFAENCVVILAKDGETWEVVEYGEDIQKRWKSIEPVSKELYTTLVDDVENNFIIEE